MCDQHTFALELGVAYVCDLLATHAAWTVTPCTACLYRVTVQVLSQPVKITVTDEGITSQVPANSK